MAVARGLASDAEPLELDSRELPLLNEPLAYLLGALTAEGYVTAERIGFNNTDRVYTARVSALLHTLAGDRLSRVSRVLPSGKTLIEYQLHVKGFRDFLVSLGLGGSSGERRVPWAILLSPLRVQRAFLRALFEGDGSVSKGKGTIQIFYSSKSENLLREVQIMLLQFGVISKIHHDNRLRGTKRLVISGSDNILAFAYNVGFWGRKQEKLLDLIEELGLPGHGLSRSDYIPFLADYLRERYRGRGKDSWLQKYNFDRYDRLAKDLPVLWGLLDEEDRALIADLLRRRYYFARVTQVQDAGIQEVYSLRVPGDNSFVGNGFVNHNTEARLAPIAMEFFEELDEETVEFVPNFDDSLKEPEVLPAKFPHVLANGAWGISVGMTTQIPPHNLRELIRATLHLLAHPDASAEELMQYLPGPDFPTGGLIVGLEGIKKAYETGEGRFRVRARAFIEGNRIVITEIPYQVKKSSILESIAAKVKSGELEGVSDLRDESDREGLRIVVELKKGTDPRLILHRLYKLTPLERTFSCHFLVIVDGAPRVLPLPALLKHFLDFRRRVVDRRTRHRLREAREREEVLEGFRRALGRLDEVVEIVRTSREPEEAKVLLCAEIGLSERQADAVLRMRLSQLTRMERQAIEKELSELKEKIAEYGRILADPKVRDGIIRKELEEIAQKYGDERRSEIVSEVEEILEEEGPPRREVVVAVTAKGYVKATERDAFRAQGRGGKGVIGIRTREGDFLRVVLPAHTHCDLLLFTDMARAFKLPLSRLPLGDRDSAGKNLRQFLEIAQDEEIRAALAVEDYGKGYCLFATRRGIVNRNPLSDYANAHSKGIIAYSAVDADRLMDALISRGKGEVLLATAKGKAIRFREEEIRVTRRPSKGVIGIRLDGDDAVVGMVWWPRNSPPEDLLFVTANGYGKRIAPGEFPLQGRGGKGVIAIRLDQASGPLVAVVPVSEGSEALVSTAKGKAIRFPVKEVSVFSRYARGVRIMRLEPGDRVASVVAL